MALLLAATAASALPYSALSLTILLAMLWITMRPLPFRFTTVFTILTIFLLTLVLASVTNRILTWPSPITELVPAILILPFIYLLDSHLKQAGRQHGEFLPGNKVRHITRTGAALFATAPAVIVIAIITGKTELTFTAVFFLIYLLWMLTRILLTVPQTPMHADITVKKIIAGATADICLNIASKARSEIQCLVSPEAPWVRISPQRFSNSNGKLKANLQLTPPLAGPTTVKLLVSVIDSRGLVQTNQTINPLKLQVIPRAKYADWLARKYLERTGNGVIGTSSIANSTVLFKGGIEYQESRGYQAGDELRAIDWRHTLKLSQLIVKEYADSREKAAIIAVNLAVSDTEEADVLAFNLITAALTLSQENIPTALAAYNHHSTVRVTTVTNPVEILKQAMVLVKDITMVKLSPRYLEPPDVTRLKHHITLLKKASSVSASRLYDLLAFEYRAIEEAAKKHPATLALSTVISRMPGPALILLISPLNHDTEALTVIMEKLSTTEFSTMKLPVNDR